MGSQSWHLELTEREISQQHPMEKSLLRAELLFCGPGRSIGLKVLPEAVKRGCDAGLDVGEFFEGEIGHSCNIDML